ncbi:MAG: hypothetical protein ACXVQY_00565 [Actinomycetota bacterium]
MKQRPMHLAATSVLGVLMCGTAVFAPSVARSATVIQPGSSLEFGDSFCTANWVYDGSGGPYIGAAAHCTTGVGQEVQLASGSLGAAIERIGQVAYVSSALDFLLVRLDAGVLSQVSPAMAGHANIPTGVSTTVTAKQGDLIQFSGHGVGFDLTSVTQQQRVGIFNFFDGGNQYVIGAVTPGDSGGPVADITDGNKAVGIVDTVGLSIAPEGVNVGEEGVAVYALLKDAAAHGFSISLRTV